MCGVEDRKHQEPLFIFPITETLTLLPSFQVIRHYHGHLSAVYGLDLHPTIDVLVTCSRDSTARVSGLEPLCASMPPAGCWLGPEVCVSGKRISRALLWPVSTPPSLHPQLCGLTMSSVGQPCPRNVTGYFIYTLSSFYSDRSTQFSSQFPCLNWFCYLPEDRSTCFHWWYCVLVL